jgi:type IV fimbrial biogenesis protein FimT
LPRTTGPAWQAADAFTIIEILIAITILAILPRRRPRILVSSQALGRPIFTAVVLARSEAIKRATGVDVSPVSASWSNGWTVKAGTTTLESAGTNVVITPTPPAT